MMLTTTTLFQGNLSADPKLHRTTGGTPAADFRVLVSRRIKDRDEQWIDAEPTGHNVRVYGRLAEAVIDQLTKGSRVIVVGRTETDAWPDPETGEKRTTTRVIVDRNGASAAPSTPHRPLPTPMTTTSPTSPATTPQTTRTDQTQNTCKRARVEGHQPPTLFTSGP